MGKKILITGGLGHIGSRLIHDIEKGQYDEVRIIDNLSTQRYASLFNLPKGVNFQFYDADILNIDLNDLVKDIDVVVHLAAITDAPSSFSRRQEVEKVNFQGTNLIAEACINSGASLLFPSTTSVYGTQSTVVDEECSINELKPQSPYAEYKLKSEKKLKELSSSRGLKFVSCRFGTIFGTSIGMRFHTAVNKFCWQAVMGKPLSVWKTALDQKRPYLGVNDAVKAINHIIDSNIFDQNVYNILTQNHTVRDIIDAIKINCPEVMIEFVDSQIMNQLSYDVSPKKFESKGFLPADTLLNSVSSTIDLLAGARKI